ncbi:MAG: NAD(P)-binding domain-containing protein, partial [Bacilli bacterium]
SETNLHFDKLKVLIIGAGGAARGIIYALSKQGVQRIIIANRTKTKSEALVNHFKHLTSMECISFDNINELKEQSISLIINTTSVGLPPNEDEVPISIPWINEKVMVSDLIYNPRKTQFLVESEQKGATIHNGLGMFINQGALAYELWTGQKPPIELMRNTIEE